MRVPPLAVVALAHHSWDNRPSSNYRHDNMSSRKHVVGWKKSALSLSVNSCNAARRAGACEPGPVTFTGGL
jgi:hypothetical protein